MPRVTSSHSYRFEVWVWIPIGGSLFSFGFLASIGSLLATGFFVPRGSLFGLVVSLQLWLARVEWISPLYWLALDPRISSKAWLAPLLWVSHTDWLARLMWVAQAAKARSFNMDFSSIVTSLVICGFL